MLQLLQQLQLQQELPLPMLLLPQQHQMIISRMMIQQQLLPPKPLLHIQRTSYGFVDRCPVSFHSMRSGGKRSSSYQSRSLVTSSPALRESDLLNTPRSIRTSRRVSELSAT